jgi:hypothetical protein
LRHKNEVADFARHANRKDEPSAAPEPSRTVDNEEWAWMVDEDPAFYLSGPGCVEGA